MVGAASQRTLGCLLILSAEVWSRRGPATDGPEWCSNIVCRECDLMASVHGGGHSQWQSHSSARKGTPPTKGKASTLFSFKRNVCIRFIVDHLSLFFLHIAFSCTGISILCFTRSLLKPWACFGKIYLFARLQQITQANKQSPSNLYSNM